ncbi:hypothetical protein ACSJLX_003192 [Serratia marcescens]
MDLKVKGKHMIRTSFGKRTAIITFFCLLVFSGVALTVGGVWLIALGGSFYYAITGIGYIAAAVLVSQAQQISLLLNRPAVFDDGAVGALGVGA